MRPGISRWVALGAFGGFALAVASGVDPLAAALIPLAICAALLVLIWARPRAHPTQENNHD
jgi:hypothetical protein